MIRFVIGVILWAGVAACAAAQTASQLASSSPFRYDERPNHRHRDQMILRRERTHLAELDYKTLRLVKLPSHPASGKKSPTTHITDRSGQRA